MTSLLFFKIIAINSVLFMCNEYIDIYLLNNRIENNNFLGTLDIIWCVLAILNLYLQFMV